MSAALARQWDFYDEDEDLAEEDGLEEAHEPVYAVEEEYEQDQEYYYDSPAASFALPVPLPSLPAPLNVQPFSYDPDQALAASAGNWHWFGDNDEALEEAEAVYGYSFQESLPRPSLIDTALGFATELFQHKLVTGLVGLVIGWLVLSTVLGWLSGGSAHTKIYNFDGVGGVAVINGSPSDNGTAAAPPASAPGSHSVQGAPTITVNKIEQVLQTYHSPAAGKGQALYDLGVKYGIDPAYALAFFIHESSAGTKGIAVTTHSLGNIRYTSDSGFGNYQGFRQYPSWEAGMEDWYKLISGLYIKSWGLQTVEAIVPKYAPSADHNDPVAYINQVVGLVQSWHNG